MTDPAGQAVNVGPGFFVSPAFLEDLRGWFVVERPARKLWVAIQGTSLAEAKQAQERQ